MDFQLIKKYVKKSCMYKGEKKEGIYYRCLIQGKYINEIPTLVKRKQINEPINKIKDPLSCTFSIIPKGIGEFYGFELDGNKRFLLSSFEVTHNTGKSTIIQDIMAYKSHICPVVQVFSGTEDSNHFFSEKCPPVCVFNKYDENIISYEKSGELITRVLFHGNGYETACLGTIYTSSGKYQNKIQFDLPKERTDRYLAIVGERNKYNIKNLNDFLILRSLDHNLNVLLQKHGTKLDIEVYGHETNVSLHQLIPCRRGSPFL